MKVEVWRPWMQRLASLAGLLRLLSSCLLAPGSAPLVPLFQLQRRLVRRRPSGEQNAHGSVGFLVSLVFFVGRVYRGLDVTGALALSLSLARARFFLPAFGSTSRCDLSRGTNGTLG